MVESDEEQLEVLKSWWDENGKSLLTTVILGLTVVFGYRAYEDNVRETGEAASTTYENLVQATTNVGDENLRITAQTLGEELKTDHQGSAYSAFAAMHLSKVAVESGDLDSAAAQLEWVISQKPEPHLESIARMRLARVLVAKGDPTAAMAKLVNYSPADEQLASWEEVRGDVFMSLGDSASARAAYELALEHNADNPERPMLELKLADIPADDATVAENETLGDEDA